MKNTPSPPAAPNPYQVANAQTAANIQTGVANTVLGNADENTPYGNVNYVQSGTYNVQVPRLDAAGNPTGEFVDQAVPRWTRNVTLTPDQQTMLNQQNQLGIGLNNVAINQTNRIGSLLGTPVDTNALPARANAAPNAPALTALGAGPSYENANLLRGYNAPTLATSLGLSRTATGFSDVGGPQRSVNQRYVANSFDDVGGPQRSVNMQNAGTTFGGAGNVMTNLGDTGFSAQRDTYEQALMSRLNPQLERDRASLETRLINQGLQRGSAGFNEALDEFNRQTNDARMQAVLAGGQEQSRMFNQALGMGQFANSAQQQMYDQALGRGSFANQAIAQNNQAALASGQFANAAQEAAYNQALGRGQFAREATGFNNAADIAAGQFYNQAQGQAFDQSQQRGLFAQNAINQNNQASLTEANFGNEALARQMGLTLDAAGFNNQAQMQQLDFNNQNAARSYEDTVNRQRYANDVAQRGFENQINSANFQNALRQQALQETMALRNQPINEISALMSGGQVSMPQFAQYNPGQVAQTPIGDYIYRNADLQNQQYVAQTQAQNAATGGLFGLLGAGVYGGARLFSDRRLKRDIRDLGIRLASGLKLYAYRYVWGERAVGVMADEVARVRPWAVGTAGAFATVDYREALA